MENNVCPVGFICINHLNAIGIISVFIIIIYVVNKENYNNLFSKMNVLEQQIDSTMDSQNQNQESSYYNNLQSNNITPDEALKDRLYPPYRKHVPINIETRESGGDFQQVGILSKNNISDDSKAPGNNTDSNILPLYGKPLYRGANKWLYYTETDKYNPIKVPINVNNQDCTDDTGCPELYDGGVVNIPSYNGNFNVKIYKFNKPRYIPYV